MSMRIEVQGQERIVRKLHEVPQAVRPFMQKAGEFAHAKAREYAKPHPSCRGTLAEGMEFKLAPGAIPLEARIKPARRIMGISMTVEEGRRPGKPPPAATIGRWAALRGIMVSGWKLAQQIRAHGTKGVFMYKRAAEDTERKLPEFLRDAVKEIERKWGR